MDTKDQIVSAKLLVANEKLKQLQTEAKQRRIDAGLSVDVATAVATSSNIVDKIKSLPPHLGWYSQTVTAVVRGVNPQDVVAPSHSTFPREKLQDNDDGRGGQPQEPDTTFPREKSEPLPIPDSISIFGHVMDAIHRQNKDGLGRVWLLLRLLDTNGEGRILVSTLRHELTTRNGRLRCLSWRRLRQLLQEGENLFWHRDKDGLYLYYNSEIRVAKTFGIDRIRGWAVEIPTRDLLGDIKSIRALFHDAFHSARGDGLNEPITRRVVEARGGGDPRTQREYEQLRGIETQANYANVDDYSKEVLTWHQGRDEEDFREYQPLGPAFTFVDFTGKLGKSFNREKRPDNQQHWHHIYIFRQMANSYSGTLRTVKRGRKWSNRRLEHLYKSKQAAMGSFNEAVRLYFYSSEAASKASESNSSQDVFYSQTTDVWRIHEMEAAF